MYFELVIASPACDEMDKICIFFYQMSQVQSIKIEKILEETAPSLMDILYRKFILVKVLIHEYQTPCGKKR